VHIFRIYMHSDRAINLKQNVADSVNKITQRTVPVRPKKILKRDPGGRPVKLTCRLLKQRLP
jgi:hypothetical protein